MRVLELSLRNYRVFEEVDLELPARVIGIFGPNGSGKSSLVEAIAFACYGVDGARTKKQDIRTQGILDDCVVRMAFEHGGRQYEVRRSLKGKGHTPEAELYVGDLLLASGATDVDAEIQRLLHMDLRVFRSSVFAEQKQLDAFSEVTPGKRKEMALRLLGIRPVDVARSAARRDARATKQSVQQLAEVVADTAALEAALKEAKDLAMEAKAAAKEAAAELKAATVRSRSSRKAFDEADRVKQRVEVLTARLQAGTEERDALAADREERAARLEALAGALAALPSLEEELASLDGVEDRLRAAERIAETGAKLSVLEGALAELPQVDQEAALAGLQAVQEELGEAQKALAEAAARRDHDSSLLAAAEERLARASEADPSQPCPTCGRELGADFPAYVRHVREEVLGARKRLQSAERDAREAGRVRTRAEARVAKVHEAGERVADMAARRSRLGDEIETLRTEVERLVRPFGEEELDVQALRGAVRGARDLREGIARLAGQREHLAQAERDLGKLDSRIEEVEGKLAVLTQEAEGLSFDPEEHTRLGAERDEAERALEVAAASERAASDSLKEAEKSVSELRGRLAEAREMEERLGGLRSEARHLERVAMLLDGFRDHLVARVGPELSREAEALFRDLTNHEYDDLRIDEETLTIQIADGAAFHPIERFSGSETDLANLALRVAISVHLSRVSGADVGMMVLDEVLASLDVERKDLFVQTMGRLAGRFHQLFVITHAEQVKDQFPASIEVRKVGRRRSVAVLV
jgi:exonuclease SbcC